MAFTVHLATAGEPVLVRRVELFALPPGSLLASSELPRELLRFDVRSPRTQMRLDFPDPGRTVSERFQELRFGELPFFDLWGQIGRTGFGLSFLGTSDIFSLFGFGKRFSGSVIHTGKRQPTVNCVVKCADGRSSQTCIVCEQDDVTIKICC